MTFCGVFLIAEKVVTALNLIALNRLVWKFPAIKPRLHPRLIEALLFVVYRKKLPLVFFMPLMPCIVYLIVNL
jgi:hypothetical protein